MFVLHREIEINIRVLLTSAPGALLKQSEIRNYLLRKSNISISNALITQIFTKTYYLKPLKSAPEALVNIFLNIKPKKYYFQLKTFFHHEPKIKHGPTQLPMTSEMEIQDPFLSHGSILVTKLFIFLLFLLFREREKEQKKVYSFFFLI